MPPKRITRKKLKMNREKRMKPRTRKCRGGVLWGNKENKNGKDILLIIDPQNDFMDIKDTFDKRNPPYTNTPFDQEPDSKGLPVPGAKTDMEKLAEMLKDSYIDFDEIHVSLDSHTDKHIGHIGFWKTDYQGENGFRAPRPLETFYADKNKKDVIYIRDFKGDEYPDEKGIQAKTQISELQNWAWVYILKMQENRVKDSSKPIPCLWAEHCIVGEDGWKVYESLKSVLDLDKFKNKVFYHEKGTNDLVEMYSIFSAELPYEELINDTRINTETRDYINNKYSNITSIDIIPENNDGTINETSNYNTKFNQKLFDRLMMTNNKVFVCGEAKSHCVKTSLEDMINNYYLKNMIKRLMQKKINLYLIEDLTSDIPSFEKSSNSAYEKMKIKGLKIIKSGEIKPILKVNSITDNIGPIDKFYDSNSKVIPINNKTP